MTTDFQTGIDALDRQITGIPPTSLLLFKTRSDIQSELIIKTIMRGNKTVYITIDKSEETINNQFETSNIDLENATVKTVHRPEYLEQITEILNQLDDNKSVCLIIDNLNFLKNSEYKEYKTFLNTLKQTLIQTESIAIIQDFKSSQNSKSKQTLLTDTISDIVFNLKTNDNTNEISNRLVVSKFRGGAALEEPIKLNLDNDVSIDTSEDY